jgi:hypothetical protein
MTLQSLESPNWDSFEILPWESRDKNHSNVGAVEKHKVYYMGEGDGFPRVWAVVS